jgi:hypothetical protein
MPSQLDTLRRLAALYVAIEEMHSTELQRVTAAVVRTKNAIGIEREAMRSASLEGHGALAEGDQGNWIMSQVRQETSACRTQKLEEIRLHREKLLHQAQEQYVASRLKRQQIQRVFDDIEARIETEEERRVQAASDDHFLARKRWTDSRRRPEGLADKGLLMEGTTTLEIGMHLLSLRRAAKGSK